MGEPQTSVFAFTADSPDVDIYRVADALDAKGWFIRRRENASIHLVLTPSACGGRRCVSGDLRQVVLAERAYHA